MPKAQSAFPVSIPITKDFYVINDYLKACPHIAGFTPFSLFDILCINENREGISFLLKVIDPESFTKVFSKIQLPDSTILKQEKKPSIILTPVLKKKIENLLNMNMKPGDTIFLSNKNRILQNIEEAAIQGVAIYKDDVHIHPAIAYTDCEFSRLLQENHEEDEKEPNTDKNNIFEYSAEPKKIFDQDIIENCGIVVKKDLSNQFYFDFLIKYARYENILSNKKTEWQYISLLLKPGIKSEKIMKDVNNFLSQNKLNLKIESLKTVSAHFYSTILILKTAVLIIFFIFYLAVILFLTFYTTSFFSTLKVRIIKGDENGQLLTSAKNFLGIPLVMLALSILAGFLLGVIFLYVLNTAGIRQLNFNLLQSLSGLGKLKTEISILPVIVSSILLIFSYFLILVISGVILFISISAGRDKAGTDK